MIIIAAMLVVRDDQEGAVPTFSVSYRIVDIVDKLLAERHVVVRMLAIAARAPIRLKEAIGGERSFRGALLEIAKVSIVAVGRCPCVGKIHPCHRLAVVAIDPPIKIVLRHQSKDALTGKELR